MATLQITARGIRIIPDTQAEITAFENAGFREGGDWVHLVRQDTPGTGNMRFLQAVRDPADLDRRNFTVPKPRSLYEVENPTTGILSKT